MTREEAIKELVEMCDFINDNVEIRRKRYKALNMAIEALSKMEAIQKVVDMPTLWEQDDRRRYNKIVDIVRNDLEQEKDKWNIPSAYPAHSILWEDNPDKRYS